MKKLNLQFLKKRYQEDENEDRMLRERVTKLLGGVLTLRDIHQTKEKITLVATNKAMAQEIFLKKAELEGDLKKEVVIR